MRLELDFLQFQPRLRLVRSGDSDFVHDPVRRKAVALTPEELLRQLVLHYLLEVKRYPLNRVRVEIGLTVNGQPRRGDIVVFDAVFRPWLLVECKSPKVALTEAAFGQAARYNMGLQVPFLAITNGLATFCCALDYEQKTFSFLPDFPDFWKRVSKFHPFLIAFSTLYNALDELHAPYAVLDSGKIIDGIRCFTFLFRYHRIGEVAVDIGECLEVAFRMAGRNTIVGLGFRVQVSNRGTIDFHGLSMPFYDQAVGFLLGPVQAAKLPINPDPEVVFFPCRYLAGKEDSFRSLVQVQ